MSAVHLPPESQTRLLRIARQTLERYVLGSLRQNETIEDPYLRTVAYGAFVSLHKATALRGCVGSCVPTQPLYQLVIEMTEAAASRDRRMAPVRAAELGDIHIDISILSALEAAPDPLSLQVGRHGLHVARGENRGVLLPQVAPQYGWDIQTFLEQTCIKAGLRKHAWQDRDTRVSSFTALILEECR
ncbi:MAG TPA: AmmeMemoRadiSam system protein A [Candidatus Binatia bacterium]|nr:AmmeMemoRadiSam system protein A [Candidatus Binatia bacterium]